MRANPWIAAVALAGCAHLPPPLAPPGPGEPRGYIAIESSPAGARAVVTRDGDSRLACAETPCRFALPPGAVQVDLSRVGYSWQLHTLAVAGEEDRYTVELRGGTWSRGVDLWGVLGMIVFIPLTALAAREDPGWAAMLGVPALASTALVVLPLAWPARSGEVLSHSHGPAAEAVPPPR